MKKIIGVVLVGMCVSLVGCGQSDQEKQQQKKEKVKQNIMGDGERKFKPGDSVGGL